MLIQSRLLLSTASDEMQTCSMIVLNSDESERTTDFDAKLEKLHEIASGIHELG